MKRALLIIEGTYELDRFHKAWSDLRPALRELAKGADGAELLGESTLLVDLAYGPATLAEAIYRAELAQLPYRVLLLENDANWLLSGGRTLA